MEITLTTKCEHRFHGIKKTLKGSGSRFCTKCEHGANTGSGHADGWMGGGSGFSFQAERRNQKRRRSRAARTFSRPRRNRSKARTELFIFQKIQDLHRPAPPPFSFLGKVSAPGGRSTFSSKEKVRRGFHFRLNHKERFEVVQFQWPKTGPGAGLPEPVFAPCSHHV